MTGTIPLGPLDLLLAALLVLANGAVSIAFDLGLGKRLAMASVRAILQLTLLGLILQWIFSASGPLPVIAMLLVMSVLAGVEAVRRTTRRVRGVWAASTGVMVASSLLVALYGIRVVLDVEPWWTPQYVIPVLGMILGNSLNGISLGLETALEGFVKERDRVELLLAHGATRREASHEIVRRSIRTGTIPILNAMIAAGMISIPGMMTGQILAGEDPAAASRYQIFILFLIAGAVALGTIGIVTLASRLVFDDRDRLRVDRIRSAGSNE